MAAIGFAGLGASSGQAEDVPLGPRTVVRFAELRPGIEAITRRDDYIREMSRFDRQVRLKTNRTVSEAELLAFMSQHVQPWRPEEIARLTTRLSILAKKLEPWNLKLPAVVLLVKTDGGEESGAAYCRGPVVVLPQNMIDGSTETIDRVLPHEIFHVLSNQNPPLRESLYAAIGFYACNEVPLPQPLADRKITNPDAPVNDHYITVVENGQPMELMPVLFSKTPNYDVARGGTLFKYMDFKLLRLENDNGTRRAALVEDKPQLFDPAAVPDFGRQIGKNTTYIIHPDEILADNFVFLVNGRIDLPTQNVVEEMGKILQAAAHE